jgi:hypothetical protein
MPAHVIRIEERLWSSATSLRKQEWRTIINDIVSGEPLWPKRDPCTLIAGCDDNHVQFLFTGSSRADDTIVFPRADIAPIVGEYAGLIKKLAGGDLHSAQFETLDMAKRVVHDSGGRKLGVLLPDVSPSLETRRRVFSLVVSLTVDTTRLGPYPAHRHRSARGR